MPGDRFLLIKAYSYILWADIEHVLGQLLIAEITNRIPVVFWSTHCLNNGFVQTNGFELYFEPVSNYTIFNLSKPEYTYYPPVWDSDNLLADDNEKETWIYRNIGDIIGSNANVVIGDVYYNVYEIIPFIKKNHTAYGMNIRQIYHYLFSKYIKVKPDIEMEIQGYYNSWIKNNHPVLAVHVRRVEKDKVFDTRNAFKKGINYWNKIYKNYYQMQLGRFKRIIRFIWRGKPNKPNQLYHSEIKKYVEKYNIKKIFLLTDCEDTLKEYQKLYGDKLLYTACKRLRKEEENFKMENPMIKRRIGIEVIKDTYIASKCDFFIGNEFSHLSQAVTLIKDWTDKNSMLLYWLYNKFKYPINVKLITKKNKNNFFTRTFTKIKTFIDKQKEYWENGGDIGAK